MRARTLVVFFTVSPSINGGIAALALASSAFTGGLRPICARRACSALISPAKLLTAAVTLARQLPDAQHAGWAAGPEKGSAPGGTSAKPISMKAMGLTGTFASRGTSSPNQGRDAFDKAWRREVLKHYRLPYFRMSSRAHGSGPFAGLSKAQRIEAQKRAISVIHSTLSMASP